MIDRGWKYYPALKLVLPYAAGIAAAYLVSPDIRWWVLLLGVAPAAYIPIVRRGSSAAAPFLLLLMFLSGALASALHGASGEWELSDRFVVRDAEAIGLVVGVPRFRGNRVELIIECDSLLYRNTAAAPDTRILLRIYDTLSSAKGLPQPGDRISVTGTLAAPSGARNPGEFDYAAYLRSHGIGLMLSVRHRSVVYPFRHHDLSWWGRAVEAVRRAARSFAVTQVGGEEGDIVRALLIGERADIDSDTRNAFAATGTIHLLAVSGLHVGVIALGLFVVVSWIPRRGMQLCCFAAVLGGYVAVAGGSPSILRAAITAVLFLLVGNAGRIGRPLNTLGAAAFAILLAAPHELFDLGFQLSFASVAGIVLLYRPLYRRSLALAPALGRVAPLRYGTQLLLLSLCAQVFTMPLLFHIFGYVSFVGPLLNIPIVPLASAGLGAAALGTAITPLTEVSSWFGGTAFLAISVVRTLAVWGSSLPITGIESGPIGGLAAAGACLALLRVAFSISLRQAMFRIGTAFLVIAVIVVAERRCDRLYDPDNRNFYLLASRNGTVPAWIRRDTIFFAFVEPDRNDSAFAATAGNGLRLRLGAAGSCIVDLRKCFSAGKGESPADIVPLNSHGTEYLSRRFPLLLSHTAQRSLRLVRMEGTTVLQVPLLRRLDHAIVLQSGTHWERIEWR